jgi:DNA repair protein RadD
MTPTATADRARITLRPYQEEAIDAILAALAEGHHPVASLPTGSGKGAIIAELCTRLDDGRVLVDTHRKELIRQNELELLGIGGADVGVYSAGLDRRETDARVVFGGIQSIYNRMDELQRAGKFKYIITDECFSAGTMIDGKPIEQIATDDWVTSYNHETEEIELRRVTARMVRRADNLLTIALDSGIKVRCTENHPFFTKEGYVSAKELSAGDYLFVRDYTESEVHMVSKANFEYDNKPEEGLSQNWANILQLYMRKIVFKCENERLQKEKQPNALVGNAAKGLAEASRDRSQAENTGWKWQRAYSSTEANSVSAWCRVDSRIFGENGDSKRRSCSRSYLVQNRYCVTGHEAGDRDRWRKSFCTESQRERQEERLQASSLRMERITSIEQGREHESGGVLVYNLEVEGNHNYFANNILVHNCHLVPSIEANPTSMHRKVFNTCPDAQHIGLTATAYRLDDGPIYGENGSWFDCLAVDVPMIDLIRQGYLAPLVGVSTAASADLSNVRKRGGDYALSDLSQASSEEHVVNAALDEICYLAQDRHSWLIFCVDVAHTRIVTDALRDRGIDAGMIVGDSRITSDDQRDKLIELFKVRQLRTLVNCNVLTTGSNLPCVDMVALLRATLSKSLCVQMLGRGTRLYPGKQDCLILDAGGNLERHRPLDGIPQVMRSPAKAEADEREEQERRERERKPGHDRKVATGIDPLGHDPIDGEQAVLSVVGMKYAVRPAKKRPGIKNLLAFYDCRTPSGYKRQVTQFLLVEYPGRPGNEARAWFERRGSSMPMDASRAMARAWNLPQPTEIVVTKNGQYDHVVMEYFDE